MRGFLTLLSVMLTYTTAVYATALTYKMDAHEVACFFATTVNKGTKLAFYFAVRLVLNLQLHSLHGLQCSYSGIVQYTA